MFRIAAAALALFASTVALAAGPQRPADTDLVNLGRYLVKTTGCNDCHTPGYAPSAGATPPEAQWLTGDAMGLQGPWGTTYPSNLRLVMQTLSEAQWLERARQPMRPPMPWFALRDMSDTDLKAIYAFVRAAGPAGQPAPAYAPPGVAVKTPVVRWPSPPPTTASK
ncbi:MAG: hypothetical protein KF871_08190 [Hydrogenophaga sp.]|uniref:c-type cytochrome n=1 Tax=Hydrogenophaga sp. TaxID=1904254 RepID=UPI001D7788DC|nr:c-type cytochrome [Hydrogenophaga sp.]MBX3609865.1 hypothetical protein [Hydrogenophaga sp.]